MSVSRTAKSGTVVINGIVNHLLNQSLSEYLGFEIYGLDGSNRDDWWHPGALIYGGALRDIIACQPIHDVDVVYENKNAKTHIELLLMRNDYNKVKGNNPGMVIKHDYNAFFDKFSLREYAKGDKHVHLIGLKDGFYDLINLKNRSDYERKYAVHRFVGEVDLSCCGLVYDVINLCEAVEGALNDCEQMKYRLMDSLMTNPELVEGRMKKMNDRGWERYGNAITVKGKSL